MKSRSEEEKFANFVSKNRRITNAVPARLTSTHTVPQPPVTLPSVVRERDRIDSLTEMVEELRLMVKILLDAHLTREANE